MKLLSVRLVVVLARVAYFSGQRRVLDASTSVCFSRVSAVRDVGPHTLVVLYRKSQVPSSDF